MYNYICNLMHKIINIMLPQIYNFVTNYRLCKVLECVLKKIAALI